MYFKTKSKIICSLFFGNNVGEGEASAAAWNTADLSHEKWLRGGEKVRPRDVASELKEMCDLPYLRSFYI